MILQAGAPADDFVVILNLLDIECLASVSIDQKQRKDEQCLLETAYLGKKLRCRQDLAFLHDNLVTEVENKLEDDVASSGKLRFVHLRAIEVED